MPTIPQQASTYIRRLRNKYKKEYASSYAAHLAHPDLFGHPMLPRELSAMGAQAVRISLNEIFKSQ